MRLSLLNILLFALFLTAIGSPARAVELAPTPVQDQLLMNLSAPGDADEDEFGDLNKQEIAQSDSFESSGKKVSVFKAAALSTLLPGLGEYYVGQKGKAKYFFAAEAVTWIGFFAFRTYGSWKEDDYIRFAAEKANASIEDKDDEFRDWVGFYDDIYQFNTLGRVSDPDRPYLEDTPENHWQWLSADDQESYRDLKNRSREAFRRSEFMIGVAILNRVISVIDAVRDARKARRTLDDSFGTSDSPRYRLSFDPLNSRQMVSLTVYTPF